MAGPARTPSRAQRDQEALRGGVIEAVAGRGEQGRQPLAPEPAGALHTRLDRDPIAVAARSPSGQCATPNGIRTRAASLRGWMGNPGSRRDIPDQERDNSASCCTSFNRGAQRALSQIGSAGCGHGGKLRELITAGSLCQASAGNPLRPLPDMRSESDSGGRTTRLGHRVGQDFRDLALSGSLGTAGRDDHGVARDRDRRIRGVGKPLVEDDGAGVSVEAEQPALD